MAANLSGMFAQMNNAIQQAPTGGGLLDIASQNLGGLAADQTGVQNRFKFMNEGAKARELKQQVGGMDLSTAEGLANAATAYGQAGDQANQLKLAQAAEAKRQQQMLRESLVARAQKHNLTGVAESLVNGGDLGEAAKLLNEYERDQMLLTKGAGARRALLKNAGITEQQIEQYKLLEADAETVKAVVDGQTGDVKPYLNASGQPTSIRTNKYGQVWDKDVQKWRNPSEMGLSPAPNVQKVHTLSDGLLKKLQAGDTNLTELWENRNNSVDQLANIDRALGLVENMVVGPGADIQMFVRRYAMLVGGDPDIAVANSEQFLAESGKRVAEIIKSFGSGTGLSDADREYAAKIAAGDINVTPEAIKTLLQIQRKGAMGSIELWDKAKAGLNKAYGDSPDYQATMALYPEKPLPKASAESGGLIYNPETGDFE